MSELRTTPKIVIVVACAQNQTIGREGGLPWHLPEDLKYFKRVTMGKPIIMGRKTFESIGRPLPGRTNIIITRDQNFAAEGISVVHSIDEAIDLAKDENPDEVMIIGGAQIYAQALARTDLLHLTQVHQDVEGDAHFPELDYKEWREVSRENHPSANSETPDYSFVVLKRIIS